MCRKPTGYDPHSSIMAISVGDLDTLSTFMLNAWTCFYNLLMRADRYQTKDELIGVLEDLKMS